MKLPNFVNQFADSSSKTGHDFDNDVVIMVVPAFIGSPSTTGLALRFTLVCCNSDDLFKAFIV